MTLLNLIKGHSAFLFFVFIGFFGMFSHWAKQWLRKETTSTLFQYLFVANAKSTAMSVLTYFGAIATLLAVGNVDYTTSQSLALAFLAGYTIDSAVNKDVQDDAK